MRLVLVALFMFDCCQNCWGFFLSAVLENGGMREPKIQFEISYQSSIKVFPLTTNFQSLEILPATAVQVSSFLTLSSTSYSFIEL